MSNILEKSLNSGLSGAGAMTVQVCTLMWMRTIMNHQYRYGKSVSVTINTLYNQGGIRRFYKGIIPALVQGPLSRFGDTFSNTLVLATLESNTQIPLAIKNIFGSLTAGIFRISLMPIDTIKTTMQVEGKTGLNLLYKKYQKSGISVLYQGAIATSSATFVGHYPWFTTYNYLDLYFPKYSDDTLKKNCRNASIGFISSAVSDIVSNSLRVIKTSKQTYANQISYYEVTNKILQEDGIKGLLGRGLKIRLITNGLQGLIFSVFWKYFQQL